MSEVFLICFNKTLSLYINFAEVVLSGAANTCLPVSLDRFPCLSPSVCAPRAPWTPRDLGTEQLILSRRLARAK